MGELAEVQGELEAEGVGIAAISVDPIEDSVALAERLDIGFPLLTDAGAEVITRYGVKMQGEIMAVPATFVVRPDRTIAWHYVGDSAPDRPGLEQVRAEAQRPR